MDKHRILMIDDDDEDFLILKKQLAKIEGFAYELDWLPGWDNSKNLQDLAAYDIALVDYRLGIENGISLIREAVNKGIPTPFILLTGMDDPNADAEAQAAGAMDFLVKGSFTPHELSRTLRYTLARSRDLTLIRNMNAALEIRVQERTQSLQKVVSELEQQVQETSVAQKKADDIQFLLKQMLTEYQVGTVTVVDRSFNCVFAGGIDYKLPIDTLIGKPIYHYLLDEYRQVVLQQLLPVFEGTRLLNFEPDWDIDDVTPSFDAFPILDLTGAVEHVVVFTRNVKERKKMEHEIQKALEKERELNELKSSFVSMASHEFRTPLTSISSSADLIALYADRTETEKIKKHSERIKHSVENLNNILGEFLSLGKLEEGKTTAQLRDMNLPDLVEDIHEELKYAFKAGQKLECHHEGNPIVQLDNTLLKNVLLNLVSNAIKYAPENTNIHLLSTVHNGNTTIKIQDKGIGISPEDQQKLFGRFFRASNATDVQGTGLGLYIVKNYVEMMGGKVTCESELGKGSTFWVEFISK
jgi:signal transduction histidine kinase